VQINPSIVLSSPMVSAEEFSVQRRHRLTNNLGRGKFTTEDIEGLSGTIYAAGMNANERKEAATTGNKSIIVITRFRLQSQVRDLLADVVVWHGNRFYVQSCDDWLAVGSGWTEARCTSVDIDETPAGDVLGGTV
jgi:hypothetical protein